MSTAKTNLLQNVAGTRPPAVTGGDFVKAYGAVNQTGTQALTAGAGVSSITDVGVGLTDFNFSIPFASTAAIVHVVGGLESVSNVASHKMSNALGASTVRAWNFENSSTAVDTAVLTLIACGVQS